MTRSDMVTDYRLPSAAAATAAAAARSAAALRHQRVVRVVVVLLVRRTARHFWRHDRRDDVLSGLQHVGIQHFGERAVADAEPQIHRLELFVDEEPGAPAALHDRQRSEQGVDRRRRRHRRGPRVRGLLPLRLSARRVGTGAASLARTAVAEAAGPRAGLCVLPVAIAAAAAACRTPEALAAALRLALTPALLELGALLR